jgi:hypothetical protein
MAPAFSLEAIRRYAMKRAAPLSIRTDYPSLEAKHFDNPRLFADREALISSLQSVKGGVIAEVGVARGDFSEYLLNELLPTKFVAIDIFTLHEQPLVGSGPSSEYFDNMTHFDFYKHRFGDRGAQVAIEIGRSDVCLNKYPDKSFDLIYIDADHHYEAVKQDGNVANAKLANNGIIVFNDYTMFDPLVGVYYGVVQAVNELIVNEDWRVCGFALHKYLFCDIAIRKQATPPP